MTQTTEEGEEFGRDLADVFRKYGFRHFWDNDATGDIVDYWYNEKTGELVNLIEAFYSDKKELAEHFGITEEDVEQMMENTE